MVSCQDFNRASQHLAAKVLHGPLDHFSASRAVNIGIQARHVGDETNFDGAGVLRQNRRACHAQAKHHGGNDRFKGCE